MADLDNIYKALRLVPEFDGNPNVLTRFINLCDRLVAQFVRNEAGAELNNLALLNGLLNKVVGPAARLINANGIPNDWLGIRNALINNFADQRDETALYNDLALLTQGSSTPQEFYERCQNLFSTIMTYVSLHETVQTTIDSKRSLYKKLTLQAYTRGLKDPLGSRIRCMRPDTIEKALEYVHEEMNTLYLQSRNENLSERKSSAQPQSLQNRFEFKMPQQPATLPIFKGFNMPGPSRPQIAYRPPPPPQNQFRQPFMTQPRMPTRTQQMFSAPTPGYGQRNASFQMPPRANPGFQGPKPMSGVSHFVSRPMPPANNAWNWARQGNPPPSNYFKSRDVNVNECLSSDDYYYVSDYDNYENYYCDTNYANFYCDGYNTDYNYYPHDYEQPRCTEIVDDSTNDQASGQPEPPSEDFQKGSRSDKLK